MKTPLEQLLSEIEKKMKQSLWDTKQKPDWTDQSLAEIIGTKFDNFKEGYNQGIKKCMEILSSMR